MAYNPITSAEIQVGQPVVGDDGGGFARKVKDNFDYLYGQIGTITGGGGVPNGSFEIDSDSDGDPDSWTKELYPGGSGAFDTTTPAHGAQAWKFTHPGGSGNGGGYLDSDYIEVAEPGLEAYFIGFLLKASVAGMKNKVEVRCYDKGKTYLSTVTVYDSTSNPTSWTQYQYQVTLPANTRYIKIRLIGGYTDTDVAGDIYFDNIIFRIMVTQPKIKISSGSFSSSGSAQTTHFTVSRYAFGSPNVQGTASDPGTLNDFKMGLTNKPSGTGSYREWYIDKGNGTAGVWQVTWDYIQIS